MSFAVLRESGGGRPSFGLARFFTVMLLTMLSLAPVQARPAGESGVFRGEYFEWDGSPYLRLCGNGERLKITGGAVAAEMTTLYSALAGPERRRVYVELRGRHHRGTLAADELERMLASDKGCKEVLRNSLFKAYGTQPDWNLYIDPTGLRLRTLADGGPIRFPYHKHWRRGPAWVFDSHNGGGDIHIELRRERCVDAASGARFAFAATVTYGEKFFAGCAYPGDLFR